MSKFYVTTSIAYVNALPHIGFAMELIQADVLARYHRQQGDDVWFLTGTDEHGLKVARAAAEQKQTPHEYIEPIKDAFKQLAKQISASPDQFIRTTDPAHEKIVQDFWKACSKDIYKSEYEGWYCVGCELFYSLIEVPDKTCPIHKKLLEKVKEENYFFKLSKYTKPIQDAIQKDELRIVPESRKNEILSLLKSGLEDISISRDRKKLSWGVPVPGDKEQVIYVWFDALPNYISALDWPKGSKYKKFWPADVHVIGKDILRQHAALWPAMLLSAGLPLPKSVYVHGFVNMGGEKISKSVGNVISPGVVIDKYGIDGLRYYLLRYIPSDTDGDFTWDRMDQVYTTDLANDLGNLVQRVAVMVTKYFGGALPEVPSHSHDVTGYHQAVVDFRFDKALAEIWQLIRGLNQFLEEEQPWKKTDQVQELERIVGHALADINLIATILLPFLPITAAKIIDTFADGQIHQEVGVLFPRSDTLEESAF